MSMLDVALGCIRRGWFVFPCIPRTKKPLAGLVPAGFKDASNDEETIRRWWKAKPDANVAIACGASDLAVLDIDHGLYEWTSQHALWEPTYAVRTGRRPEIGIQMYFKGAIPDVGLWKMNGSEGQVKSLGGYVMAAGSIHPSGEAYENVSKYAADDLLATPMWVQSLKTSEHEALKVSPGQKIAEGSGRHHALTSEAGKLRNMGWDESAIYAALLVRNEELCEVPIPDDELRGIARSVTKLYPAGETLPEIVIGKPVVIEPEEPKDWRDKYHTFQQMDEAPPVTFLIKGFLTEDAVTGLAAPVAQRKSLIALNIVHALLTGERLFDHFEVVKQPERVLYLCPEMGLQSFSERIREIGLMSYVGHKLFCRTMASEGHITLAELTAEELHGAVVVLDTAIRFLEGDENSSVDMRAFAASVFRLISEGALSVVLLHHSHKGTKESNELTLENSMRGSGELGAFLASCWSTRLQNPDEPYKSASFLVNTKQRDFKSTPFEAVSDERYRMRIVNNGAVAVLKSRTTGNRDGREEEAISFIRDNPKLAVRKIEAALLERGIERGTTWINKKRKMVSAGVSLSED